MPNHAGALQGRFLPAKLETEGDDVIFNTLLSEQVATRDAIVKHFVIYGILLKLA